MHLHVEYCLGSYNHKLQYAVKMMRHVIPHQVLDQEKFTRMGIEYLQKYSLQFKKSRST